MHNCCRECKNAWCRSRKSKNQFKTGTTFCIHGKSCCWSSSNCYMCKQICLKGDNILWTSVLVVYDRKTTLFKMEMNFVSQKLVIYEHSEPLLHHVTAVFVDFTTMASYPLWERIHNHKDLSVYLWMVQVAWRPRPSRTLVLSGLAGRAWYKVWKVMFLSTNLSTMNNS